ncbi:hypothetical protein F0U59_24960 [Archangium gephyra]|nr:hypothetical protein F0U59_24960 [Archangium gephyra]
MHTYYVLARSEDETLCVLDKQSDELDEMGWMFFEGEGASARYPANVHLQMGRDYPGMKVPDLVPNTFNYVVVSERLKAVLEREAGVPLEFHPVSIVNHKDRKEPAPFFIANVLGKEDCVDSAATDADESAMVPGTFSGIYRLALDPARIPPEARLFRLKQMPSVLVIRDDLREALDRVGLEGLRYIAMGEDCVLV